MSAKKVVSFVMALCMVLSLAACGGNNPSSANGSKAESKDESSSKAVSTVETKQEPDADTGLIPMADRDKPVTYNIFVRDPGQAPAKDNPILNKVTELTGVTMQFEFLVGDLDQKIGVMVAGGEYPDVVMAEPAKFIEAGAFIPLNDLLPKYPNLWQQYEPVMEKMKNAYKDGNAYLLEIYNLEQHNSPMFQNGGAGFYIQKDVLADAGNKANPRTVDEYFDLIQNYKKKNPMIGDVKTIGFEILTEGWRSFCLRNPAMHLMGDGNQGDVYVDYATNKASYYQISDAAKAYYKKLNDMYHAGVIEAETLTQSYDQYISRMSTGAVLGMFDQRWNFQNAENLLKADGKYERTYVSVPVTNPGIPDGYLDAKKEISGAGGIGITTKCKEPERLLAFYDWLIQRDVQDYLNWGVKDVDYKVGEEGKYLTPERRALVNDTALLRNKTAGTLLNYSPKRQGLYEDGEACTPADSIAEYKAQLSEYDVKFLQSYGFDYQAEFLSAPVVRPSWYPVWSFVIDESGAPGIAKAKLEDLGMSHYPNLIICDPADYDTKWNEFLADWEAANVNPYLDDVNKQIQEKIEQAKKS